MDYQTLKVDISGPIAKVTLNRPQKRNAITRGMIEELLTALGEIETHPARVLILTGAGKSFCSGMDLEDLKSTTSQSPAEHLEETRLLAQLYRTIWSYPKPTIAAVNGPAIAGGCGLATLCDFTISATEATFGYPEVHIGFLPAIVSVFLLRQIGEKKARDLLLTGRIINADEAQRLGLVTNIVGEGDLPGEVEKLAQSLLACSAASLRETKTVLCDSAAPELDRELELAVAAGARIRSTADFREGLESFLEKRTPRWSSQ